MFCYEIFAITVLTIVVKNNLLMILQVVVFNIFLSDISANSSPDKTKLDRDINEIIEDVFLITINKGNQYRLVNFLIPEKDVVISVENFLDVVICDDDDIHGELCLTGKISCFSISWKIQQ
jgi:hypothetical protein